MSDEKLIRAVTERDEAAIARIIERYSRLLWSVASAALEGAGCAQDAEECVADTFISLWNHPEKFDPKRGSLKTFLSVAVRTKALDRRRALSRRDSLPLEEAAHIPHPDQTADDLLQKEDLRALRAAIDTLDEPDREIVLRRWFSDQKPRQIALALGISVKQVENRLYRAKKKLRELL